MEAPFASKAELADYLDIDESDLPRGADLVLRGVSARIVIEAPLVSDVDPAVDDVDAIRTVCLQASARAINTTPGVRSERAGKASVTYDTVVGLTLTDDEISMLGAYIPGGGSAGTIWTSGEGVPTR